MQASNDGKTLVFFFELLPVTNQTFRFDRDSIELVTVYRKCILYFLIMLFTLTKLCD